MSKFMNRPPPVMSTTALPNNSTFVEKIMVGLDHAPAAFDLRGQIIGAGGANLHYIRNETGAIATLRGRGSLFVDPTLGIESLEPMHLYIEHTRFDGLQSAKQLAKNLIETLQQELVHFQQINPPVPNVQYTQQSINPITSQVIPTQQTVVSQMSVPPPMLAVPPPTMIQQSNTIEQMNAAATTSIIQQSANLITQNTQTMMPVAQQSQLSQLPTNAPQQTILQQQTIVPQTVPIHLHQGNMVIQQQVQTSNVNMPPPNFHHIPLKQGSIVHLQGPPPASMHLSQPPPNIQLQQPQTTQIVLNQPQSNYQYQYIQQSQLQSNDNQQNQVTIQHIYQPQSIVQQATQPATHVNHFTSQQTIRSSQPQQYILQGNTAYMVPPPNIIQQQPPPIHQHQHQSQTQQNIIFQTAPPQPGQMQLQQIQLHPPPNLVDGSVTSMGNDENNGCIKDEKRTPEPNESPIKSEDKSDTENHEASSPNSQALSQQLLRPPPQLSSASAISTVTQVPPPMTCVQHIVGNTLITTSQPTSTQTHQIYNQIPVSIQQIQASQQQIHVSTQNGQHFLVNTQQWPPQQPFQQLSQNGNIQSFHLAAPQQLRNPNEIVVSNQTLIASSNQSNDMRQSLPPQSHYLTTTFNPHLPAPTMQVQFQPLSQQQIMQNIENQSQLIEHQQQSSPLLNNILQPPPSVAFNAIQQQQTTPLIDNQGKINAPPYPPPATSPQPVPYPQQLHEQQRQQCHKRKRGIDDDLGSFPHHMPPRMGMGLNNGGQFLNNQRENQPTTSIATANSSCMSVVTSSAGLITTANTQDELTTNGDNSNNKALLIEQHPPLPQQQQKQHLPNTYLSENRQYYRMHFDGSHQSQINAINNNSSVGTNNSIHGPSRAPLRFHSNNNRNDFSHSLRPPPQHIQDANFPIHRMNFGPPPPPPPMFPRLPQSRFRAQW